MEQKTRKTGKQSSSFVHSMFIGSLSYNILADLHVELMHVDSANAEVADTHEISRWVLLLLTEKTQSA
jgi:hypothetical protein